MKDRVMLALENNKKGYNCAQAVFCAYCDRFDLPEETAFMISEGFGRGMGGLRDGTCGAVSAMSMLAGLQHSSGGVQEITKQKTYQKTQRMCAAFKEKNGSILCADLLGLGAPGVKRACTGCIEDAVRILEQMLEEPV